MVCYLAFASKKWDSIQPLRSFIKCHQDNIMAPVSNTHILDFLALIITRKQNRRVRVLVIRIPLYFPFFPILLCFCFSVSAGCFCPEQVKIPSVWQEVVLLWLAHENTGDTLRSWDREAREPPESGGPPAPGGAADTLPKDAPIGGCPRWVACACFFRHEGLML